MAFTSAGGLCLPDSQIQAIGKIFQAIEAGETPAPSFQGPNIAAAGGASADGLQSSSTVGYMTRLVFFEASFKIFDLVFLQFPA